MNNHSLKGTVTNLFKVKSILTIIFTIAFIYAEIHEISMSENFNMAFIAIITYYFSRKGQENGRV